MEALCEDIKSQKPDHVALTGDLVNLGLPDEFIQAEEWLQNFGSPDWVSLTPGNHDSYTRLPPEKGMLKWAPYMRSDKAGATYIDNSSESLFPYIRFLQQDIAVIGLSSSVPTLPFMATGTIGGKQRAILQNILKKLSVENIFCIIMIHHPPLAHLAGPRRGLTDAEQLQVILESVSHGIVLHGHNHRNSIFNLSTGNGILPIIGVPSASCGKVGKEPLARYNLLEINRSNGTWECIMTGRGYGQSLDDGITDLETVRLL